MRRFLLPAIAVAAVVVLIAVEVLSAGSGSGAGKPAPALPSAVLQPPRATLETLRGKPALVDFFASWCEPCRQEAPALAQLQRSPHGARIVAVDYTDRAGAARQFVRRYGWRFPVLSDPDGVVGARYGFSGLPTSFVLDSQGKIVETLRGPQSLEQLEAALDAARGQS
jgi:cytochrome c biogenesis protein CcmG/thiol:disulfide interchange protein DsbE